MGCRAFFTTVLMVGALVAAHTTAQPLPAQRSAGVQPIVVQPVPRPMANRYSRLQARLKPSARAWLEQQARIARGNTALNLPATETAIRSRFRVLPGSPAVDQGVFIVVMMMADQSARDIPGIAAQVNRLKDAKQKVVGLMSDVQQERAGNPRGNSDLPCRSTVCQSLAGRARAASDEAARAGHPIRLTTAEPLTYARLSQFETALGAATTDLDSFGEMEQLRLQMLMDQRAKYFETASNILKKIGQTDDGIVESMK
jgi:hypothetical protein